MKPDGSEGHNGYPEDAIRHALAAHDLERAADLIERTWREKDINYQYDTWLGWVKSLPDEIVRAHPVICVGYAWALLGTGELEASEARLRDAGESKWTADRLAVQVRARLAGRGPAARSIRRSPRPTPRPCST